MSKGRGNSNSLTIAETIKINIDNLLKSGCFVNGRSIYFTINWTNGAAVCITANCSGNKTSIELNYTTKEQGYKYRVFITNIKSNLGSGNIYFFICPVSKKKCKTLFFSSQTGIFCSWKSQIKRIYYYSQIASKVQRSNARLYIIDKKINKLKAMNNTKSYNGKLTRRYLRTCSLYKKRDEVELIKQNELDEYLHKLFKHLE